MRLRYAPGIDQLIHYQRVWLRGDIIAGITVAAYLIPQVMAYAELAGLPAVAGLWAVIGSMTVYALLGSSCQLSVGPESTTALMTATALAPLANGDPAHYAALCAGLGLMVGAIALVGYLARLGFLADLLSKPVLVGYLAGVAVIMIAGQLEKFSGVPIDEDNPLRAIWQFLTHLDDIHGPTLLMSTCVLVFLFVGSKLFPRTPMPLIAILLAAGAVKVFDLGSQGLDLVGSIPTGLPTPRLPGIDWSDVQALLLPAVGVTIVAYSDNALTGRAFANRNKYPLDANQELLALAGANAAAGVMRGFPVSSSGSRTVIGDSLGSKSQLYSLIVVLFVILTLLFLGPLLETFPRAALAALVVWAATRLIDIPELIRIGRFRTSELVLALATTAAVLVVDILYGILVAIALSILDVMRRVARPHDGVLGYVPGVAGMHDVDDYPGAKQVPGLLVYRYDSPLFFANAENFKSRALAAIEAHAPVEWVLLNFEANVQVDLTSVDALGELLDELEERGIKLALARVKHEMEHQLEQAGLVQRIGKDHIFDTLPTAVRAYIEYCETEHGEPPPGVVVPPPPASPIVES